ncbi:hypothetical protein N8871_02225 [Candidatus Pelagibacter sp.]|jgi:hypothetical protein|nr:hypothetical protein [Candidatus Pelagibacter sp.]
MKKLLGIVVLGLLLSGNAYAVKKYKKGTYLSWGDTMMEAIDVAREHCEKKDKRYYWSSAIKKDAVYRPSKLPKGKAGLIFYCEDKIN